MIQLNDSPSFYNEGESLNSYNLLKTHLTLVPFRLEAANFMHNIHTILEEGIAALELSLRTNSPPGESAMLFISVLDKFISYCR